MLKIRLTRKGKKNKAFFRLVAAEHTAPIKGRFVEVLGFLNPHTKEKNLKVDRIKYWIEKGAQCSDTVHNLLVANGVVKGPKRAVKIKQKTEEKKSEETAKTEEKPVEEKKEKKESAEKEEVKPEKKSEPEKEAKAGEKKEEVKEEKTEEEKPKEKKETSEEK